MITCPECGQEAPDGAKFCDRCGQGLSKSASSAANSSPTRPTPLTAGASLKGGIEIVALTSQTSIENRYSAKRLRDGKTESIALRERLGPHPAGEVVEDAPAVEMPKPAPRTEDPNGPSAKTAELRPPISQTNGSASPSLPPSRSRTAALSSADASGEGAQSAVEADTSLAALEEAAENASPDEASEAAEAAVVAETRQGAASDGATLADESPAGGEDLGEVFGRVLALSQTIGHPAFQRATEGFAENGRVYLVYA
ncbi:MAG: zinc ribbon domain-containing protein, partial [Candidatus Binatus sp.]